VDRRIHSPTWIAIGLLFLGVCDARTGVAVLIFADQVSG
jgi:hypothetical protein